MGESEEKKLDLVREESRLLNEIEAQKEELIELQMKQTRIFEMVQQNMNNALQDQFKNY